METEDVEIEIDLEEIADIEPGPRYRDGTLVKVGDWCKYGSSEDAPCGLCVLITQRRVVQLIDEQTVAVSRGFHLCRSTCTYPSAKVLDLAPPPSITRLTSLLF
jgi:hypothetical protein